MQLQIMQHRFSRWVECSSNRLLQTAWKIWFHLFHYQVSSAKNYPIEIALGQVTPLFYPGFEKKSLEGCPPFPYDF